MKLSPMDHGISEADPAPGRLGGRDGSLLKEETSGHLAQRWNRRYAGVDSVEARLQAVSCRSYEWISSGWTRLLDRQAPPRCWWWPAPAEVPLRDDDLERQHAQCSETTNRLLFTLLGFCLFCLLTLGGSDAALLGANEQVTVPVVNISLSIVAFLLVGPLVLIALSLYLHILTERLRRYNRLNADQRLPYLFNMCDPVSRLISWLLLYWMVPLVLALFTWKAGPRPEAPLIGSVAIVVTALLIWLQMRRCPTTMRSCNIPLGVGLIVLLALIPCMATGQIPLNRSLNLFEAVLEKRDLSGFDLRGANLSRANLQKAYLSKANLREATLKGADLSGAILQGAILSGADLSWAKGLREADLRQVDFEGANLTETNLQEADLSGAILRGTVFYQADLRGTNLEAAVGLTREQVESAMTDHTTRLPIYLQQLAEKRL